MALTFDEIKGIERPDPAPNDLIRAAQLAERQSWLRLPHTKEFLGWLENEINQLHSSAVEKSELLSESELKLEMVKEKQLTKVLNYAKQNTP